MADVKIFTGNHLWMVAQLPIELGCTHIEGVNFVRAALQQAVGKSSGGRSNIEANSSHRIDGEIV